MRIDLVQAPTPACMGPEECCVCERYFEQGPVLARLLSDDTIPVDVGVVCPQCLEGGAEHIEGDMRTWATWSRMQADQDERLAREGVAEMPSLQEYQAFTELFDGPRFASERAAAEFEGEEYWGSD